MSKQCEIVSNSILELGSLADEATAHLQTPINFRQFADKLQSAVETIAQNMVTNDVEVTIKKGEYYLRVIEFECYEGIKNCPYNEEIEKSVSFSYNENKKGYTVSTNAELVGLASGNIIDFLLSLANVVENAPNIISAEEYEEFAENIYVLVFLSSKCLYSVTE